MLSYRENAAKRKQERTISKNLDNKSEKSRKRQTTNDGRRVSSHRQLMHAFPRLGGFKGADLDPMGVFVDISRTEKGRKGVALMD